MQHRIPKEVRNEINRYYAFRGCVREAILNELPNPHPDWKETCLNRIAVACEKYKIGLVASAGTFFLRKGKILHTVNQPFPN